MCIRARVETHLGRKGRGGGGGAYRAQLHELGDRDGLGGNHAVQVLHRLAEGLLERRGLNLAREVPQRKVVLGFAKVGQDPGAGEGLAMQWGVGMSYYEPNNGKKANLMLEMA